MGVGSRHLMSLILLRAPCSSGGVMEYVQRLNFDSCGGVPLAKVQIAEMDRRTSE